MGASYLKSNNVGRHFYSDFQEFCPDFWGLCLDFQGLCPDFQKFCPEFQQTKILGVRFHPLHPATYTTDYRLLTHLPHVFDNYILT